MPFVFIPQAWKPPALTAVKVPAGGVAWPLPLRPQQATMPFVLTPQVWKPPALTAVKAPVGGVAWPKSSEPQQETVPVVPHAAGVGEAGAHSGEGARRADVAWPKRIGAPAGDGAAGVLTPQV